MKWILPIYLFLAPLLVSLAQISVLDFPTENPFFMGIPYSPYPQVFYIPIFEGIFLMKLSISGTLILASQWYRELSIKIRFSILILFIAVTIVLFWFGINLAQRMVILEYLTAINANGLHFMEIFMLPIMPKVFPNNSEFPFTVLIMTGVIGLISIPTQYITLFNRNSM